jgi:uncharacterized damage-inducible protein DinB
MVDNEDMMINYVIPGRVKDWVRRNPEEFSNMDSIKKHVREVESKTTAYAAKMKPAELERKVEVARPGTPPTSVRVEDILTHVVIENVHHFGELIALFWQIDIEPPHLGWITYIQKAK